MSEEEPTTPQRSDPVAESILVLQVLQVKDRDCFRAIKEAQQRLDDAKDELNGVVEEIFNLQPGFVGFVHRAVFGAQVPIRYARLLEAVQEKIAALEHIRNALAHALEQSRLLALEAEATPDHQNTLTLRRRALAILERDVDEEPLLAAQKRVDLFRKLLEEEADEEGSAPEEIASTAARRPLAQLSSHFEEFKAKKVEEVRSRLLQSDIGQKGWRKLNDLVEHLERKREANYTQMFGSE
ncbi:MAG: hypothetical protein KDD69_01395 [Bdellovibrionales bacterium]|nr:hypothetical protein [Bdellovibrionales bacterium]